MAAKRILAGIFAVFILLKLIILVISPHSWGGVVQAVWGHQTLVMLIYLVLAAITGYYAFSTLDLIDIAVVMFFTSMFLGLSIFPYVTSIMKSPAEIISLGLGKAWLAVLLWGVLAVAVLYRLLAPGQGQGRQD